MTELHKNELVRIRLVRQPNFSGTFGNYRFINGESEPMIRREAERLSAITTIEFIDAPDIWERKSIERGILFTKIKEQDEGVPAEVLNEDLAPKPEAPAEQPIQDHYTREQLEAIVDKEGAKGLRVVGDKFGVKAASVATLIELILEKQHG